MNKDFKEIFVTEIVAVTGSIFAGALLTLVTNKLEALPALFIILPGFMGMKGGVGGSLGARISSALHKGVLKPRKISKKVLFTEIFISFLLLTCLSLFLGFLAFTFSYLLLGEFYFKILLVPIFAVLLTVFIEIPLFIYSTVWLYSHNHDPDNIMGPYITTLNDITSVITLVIAAGLLL